MFSHLDQEYHQHAEILFKVLVVVSLFFELGCWNLMVGGKKNLVVCYCMPSAGFENSFVFDQNFLFLVYNNCFL